MNKGILNSVSYLGYFFVGLVTIIRSPTLPFMIQDFNISLAIAGAVFTFRSIGSFFGVLLGGILSDVLGRKPLIVLGCLIQGIALAATALTKSWSFVLLFLFINGMAGGSLSTSLNALIAELNAERRGAALNALHGIYGLGSLIGPLLIGLILTWQFGWRAVYYGAAALWILFMILILASPFPKTKKEAETSGRSKIELRAFLLNPVFLLLFFVSFIYNGSAHSLVGWINTYMNQLEYSAFLGSSMLTIFYLGLTIGRFLCSAWSDRIGYSRIILYCTVGSLAFYPAAIYSGHPLLIAIGVFLSGLFLSGLHPTGLAYANKLFPDSAGTATGILSAAMSLGAGIVPWLAGIIADKSGFRAGLGLGLALLIVLMVVAVSLKRMDESRKEI